jgi:hypothetical protein
MMKSKEPHPDDVLTDEDRKATMRGRPAGPPPGVSRSTPTVELPAPPADAEQLLVELEARCASGGSAGLDDIRAVLAKLRGV